MLNRTSFVANETQAQATKTRAAPQSTLDRHRTGTATQTNTQAQTVRTPFSQLVVRFILQVWVLHALTFQAVHPVINILFNVLQFSIQDGNNVLLSINER